ncbi:MAG TPA: type IX secretion system membrane protein PorP/SprF [Bacteroidetes bacterium]|nr:type IX secretion system membrane protein PorP/SprF [Bacteroidota bacterium]
MKNIISTILFAICFAPFICEAQQQPHNTQFMYYKLGYNPGFAGSQDAPCVSAIIREQWLGLEGAPSVQAITFNMPIMNQRVGIGANLMRHSIGITTVYDVDLAYAYRLRLGQGMLGIGVQGSVRSFTNDFMETVATQSKTDDTTIPGSNENKFMFNFGTGVYYSSERFYIGLSAPRLLANSIDFNASDNIVSREVQHVYLMTGYTATLSDELKLRPQIMFKYANNAPVDADINLNFLIQDKFVAGLTYRLGGNKESGAGESLDAIFGVQLNQNLLFAFSYDYTLSDIGNFSDGSIEASFHYCIGKLAAGSEFENPRFF